MIEVSLTVNGKHHTASIEPAMPLMDFLRDILSYKGVKVCCNTGECGACTILLDGKPVNSCLVLAADAAGSQVITIEGIAEGERLHPLQEAFIHTSASQCGYCTPGFIMSAKVLLDQNPSPTLQEIKTFIAGNICRCTGYVKIVEAIQLAAEWLKNQGKQL